MKQFYQALTSLLFFTWSLSLSAVNPTVISACNPIADSLELVKFYQNFDGPNWTDNTNWLVPGMPINTWYGVWLDFDGCVRQLNLPDNQLNGPMYDINLPKVGWLFLNDNLISGQIPDFSNLPNLHSFTASSNQLTGSIPDFADVPTLEQLDLGQNQIEWHATGFFKIAKP